MSNSVTLRFDDEIYRMIELAAQEKRVSVAGYIMNATIAHLEKGRYVSDEEMQEILDDKDLLAALERARVDIANGNYRIVE